jgi:hypothetical protein
MIKLDLGNVLLKPSQRKQLMACLRRTMRLGDRLGNFVLTLRLNRVGRHLDVRADVHDSAGDFAVHMRDSNFRTAVRKLVRTLSTRIHDQLRLARVAT